jgi:DtxR family transcriptional regulator, Mn-dependent transcriptional regulator
MHGPAWPWTVRGGPTPVGDRSDVGDLPRRRSAPLAGTEPRADPGMYRRDPAKDERAVATTYPSVESLVTEVLEVMVEDDAAGRATSLEVLRERLPVAHEDLDAALASLRASSAVLEVEDGSLLLTDRARADALARIRRHRLTARLLSDVIGIDWWKVHRETARWEGLVSDDVEARVVALLGDPGTCPHGNPIPGSAHVPEHPDAVRLAHAPVGPVHVVRVTETLVADDEALQLLQGCGFLPGRDAEIVSVQEGWVQVAGSIRDAALPPHIAQHVVVAPR